MERTISLLPGTLAIRQLANKIGFVPLFAVLSGCDLDIVGAPPVDR
jgi:hypothetical protein